MNVRKAGISVMRRKFFGFFFFGCVSCCQDYQRTGFINAKIEVLPNIQEDYIAELQEKLRRLKAKLLQEKVSQ